MESKQNCLSINLKRLLKKLNYSQVKFAQKLGINKNTVNLWCAGKTFPNYQQLDLIINFCLEASPAFNPLCLFFNNYQKEIDSKIKDKIARSTKKLNLQIDKLNNEISELKSKNQKYVKKYEQNGELYRLRKEREKYKDYKREFYKEKKKYISDEKVRVHNFFHEHLEHHIRVLAKDILDYNLVKGYIQTISNDLMTNFWYVRDKFAEDLGKVFADKVTDELVNLYMEEKNV